MSRTLRHLGAMLMGIVLFVPSATAATITFEGFADGTALSTQVPGLVFSNATVATARPLVE